MKQTTKLDKEQFELTELKPENFDGKLRERIEKLVEASKKAVRDKDGLRLEVKIEEMESCGASISVSPKSDWMTEGELGSEFYHIILGVQGGVRHSKQVSKITHNETDIHKKTKAFSKTVSRLERAG